MVRETFHPVILACMKRSNVNVKRLVTLMQQLPDQNIHMTFDNDNFDIDLTTSTFFNKLMSLRYNRALIWLLQAADKFDPAFADFVEMETQKILDDAAVSEVEKSDVRLMLQTYREDLKPLRLCKSRTEEPILYGSLPVADGENFLPPNENQQIREIIRNLWYATQPGCMLIQGEKGIGKTTIITMLMHDREFLATLPDLQAVFVLQGYRISHKNEADFLLQELEDLFQKANLEVEASSSNSLKDSLGLDKKYLLIIDDAYSKTFAEIAVQLFPSTRCILISRTWSNLEICVNYVTSVISLELDNDFIRQIYQQKSILPPIILQNRPLIDQFVKMSCGLPLIANVIWKLFKQLGDEDFNEERSVRKRYEQIVTYTTSSNNEQKAIVNSLLKLIFTLLPVEDRRRYYAFLFFNPGQTVDAKILAILWKTTRESDVEEICKRFLNFGIVTVNGHEDYAIHSLFHDAALQDAVQQGVATGLKQLRMKMISGELMQTQSFRHKLEWFFANNATSSQQQNLLQIAINSQKWHVVEVIVENADNQTLLKFCSDGCTPLRKILMNFCSNSRPWQRLFLKMAKRLSSQAKLDEDSVEITQFLYDNKLTRREKAVMVAAGFGQLTVLRFLQGQRAISIKKDETGKTPLMEAAYWGHLAVVEFLVSNGADLNEKDNCGETALMKASCQNHLEIVRFLVLKGASLSEKNEDGETVLAIASRFGSLEVVRFLGLSLKDERNKQGETPLMIASSKDHLQIIHLLATASEDLDKKNNDGFTSLMLAAYFGHIETAKLLVEKGANVNEKTGEGYTALMLASSVGNLEIVQFLVEKAGAHLNEKIARWGETALTMAAREGHLEVVKLLVMKGGYLNEKDNIAETALMKASREGHIQIVKFLVQFSANFDEINNIGETALMLAASKGHLEIVQFLFYQGVDLNNAEKSDIYGDTVLMRASGEGHLETVRFLVTKGANLKKKNNKGETAWMKAAKEGHLDVVQYLVGKSVDLNEKTYNQEDHHGGQTALMMASNRGHLNVVKFLTSKGANLNEKDCSGWTALMYAARQGHLPVVRFLVNNDASLEEKDDKWGETALMMASNEGHLEVVTFLQQSHLANK